MFHLHGDAGWLNFDMLGDSSENFFTQALANRESRGGALMSK